METRQELPVPESLHIGVSALRGRLCVHSPDPLEAGRALCTQREGHGCLCSWSQVRASQVRVGRRLAGPT